MKKNYTLNYATKEITITKAFGKKASDFGTPEFELMKKLREEYSDFTFVYRKIDTNENKESYKGLTRNKMVMFFDSKIRVAKENVEKAEESEVKELSKEVEFYENGQKAFGLVVKMATDEKTKKVCFPTVRKWFIKNFSTEYKEWCATDEFDVKKEGSKKAESPKETPKVDLENASVEDMLKLVS